MANPTSDAAEAAINLLEGGAGSVLFASGQAAIYSALVTFLKSGDHVVSIIATVSWWWWWWWWKKTKK